MMFEKEAEEYFETECLHSYADTEEQLKEDVVPAFQKGAEFGYNKAKEEYATELKEVVETCNHWQEVAEKANKWHYVKDGDLPPKKLEEKPILVRVRRYDEEWFIAYYMLDGYNRKNGKRFYADIDQEFSINIKDVIAWKEVVLPEEE